MFDQTAADHGHEQPGGTPPRRHRRLLILADGRLGVFTAKTAACLLRYRPGDVVAIIDSANAGGSTRTLLGVEVERPIVADLGAGLRHAPDALVVGVAPRGGGLPGGWRGVILAAIDAGLDVLSGLHVLLGDDPELAARARCRGVTLFDLRRPPARLRLPREGPGPAPGRRRPHVLLTAGSDCNVGKLTAALELVSSLRARGVDAALGATGQTGILLAGSGIPIDRVIADFVAGATEELVDGGGAAGATCVVVEGQGSLLHPAFSGVTLGLLHGARPDAIVLCHHVGRTEIAGYGVRIPGPGALRRLYEEAAAWVQPAPVVGFALNGHGAAPGALATYAARVRAETGLEAADPLAEADRLVDAILQRIELR